MNSTGDSKSFDRNNAFSNKDTEPCLYFNNLILHCQKRNMAMGKLLFC